MAITFPIEIIQPVMDQFKVSKEEATQRLQNLSESGIMQNGHPDDIETQKMIDDFLEKDSNESALLVLFDKTLTKCMEDKSFVKEYDRIAKANFTKCLREMNENNPPKNTMKQLRKFSDFVRNTVYAKLLHDLNQNQN